ncbi:hypothetical protein EX975_25035 [Salmonella enterica subsp. enterica serovar Gaminara]|nr:hypothetical protein [Salmonella enterica subsp. enterica serovar Montevideo]EAA4514913.1 hypothetical protein [Salmonella enterica subsp. enterica serovar Vitkin]EAB1502507.1 hypothetical protein [Salmonella enterica]EAB7211026.1 hypothetical protein [Salmonella enterica subsp. enterica serovar Cotham]EBF8307843.1 hypothetical protein [Salmonella enterica subsp. enterica serovar Ealing]EBG0233837.1 hypothetical protein [Salmonella enterica subsp. enterica serovar Monschaui]EBG8143196.1 hy
MANADTSLNLQEKSRNTSEAIVSSVSSAQKLRNEKLKLQLQIDELRVKIGGTLDPQKREELQQKMDLLVKQKQKIQ